MIVTSDNPILVNGDETSSFSGNAPLTITQAGADKTVVTITNNGRRTVVSKLAGAQEHKIHIGKAVIVVLRNRELTVYEP